MTAWRRRIGLFGATALLLATFGWLVAADETRRATQAELATTADETVGLEVAPAPAAFALRSKWVSQTVPEVIRLGETATAIFVFQNIGSAPWIRGTAAEARLGVLGDDRRFFDLGLALRWPAPDRLAVQAEPIVPVGSNATFTIGLLGSVTGRHHIRVRPVVDGIAWMDDDGAYFDVVVTARGY